MLIIPQSRKRTSTLRLCLIMGMTVLLFLIVSHRLGTTVEAVITAPQN